jgi:hypothetical protein
MFMEKSVKNISGPTVRRHLHQLDVPDHDVRRPLRHPRVPQQQDWQRDPPSQNQEEKND